MIDLKLTSNLDKTAAQVSDAMQKQVPYATSIAINRIAELSKPALQAEMSRVFDRPKPYTLNSIFIKRATKSNLTATIFHGDAVASAIAPEIVGGARDSKKFELIIGRWKLVPTASVKLDAYGNPSKALITQVLSQCDPERKLPGSPFFMVEPGQPSKLSPGIYQRQVFKTKVKRKRGAPAVASGGGSALIKLFEFKESVTYKQRYDMQGVVGRVVESEWPRQFPAAMDLALQSAKVKL